MQKEMFLSGFCKSWKWDGAKMRHENIFIRKNWMEDVDWKKHVTDKKRVKLILKH
jgi:hypothetical protein